MSPVASPRPIPSHPSYHPPRTRRTHGRPSLARLRSLKRFQTLLRPCPPTRIGACAAWWWTAIPLIASLYTFSHRDSKEAAGFFRGFPSYWNIVAFYVAFWLHHHGPFVVLAVVLVLSVLSVTPMRFVYPNRAPRWRVVFVVGGGLWLVTLIWILVSVPDESGWLIALSSVYPAFYTVASIYLDLQTRGTAS